MWKEEEGKLIANYTFVNFKEAWAFLNKVAELAEKHKHHPEIRNVYNKVTLTLCTHDKGNTITEKDISLSQAINQLG